jgi:hypothetical protein
MIGADAHGRAVFLADPDQRQEFFADAFQFGVIGCIGVIDRLKALLVGIVPGIDADFFHDARGQLGSVRCKVDIGYERRMVAPFTQLLPDLRQVLRFFHARCRNAHVFTSRLDHADGLRNRPLRIHRVDSSHGLDADGITATHRHVAYRDLQGQPAAVLNQTIAITLRSGYRCIHNLRTLAQS